MKDLNVCHVLLAGLLVQVGWLIAWTVGLGVMQTIQDYGIVHCVDKELILMWLALPCAWTVLQGNIVMILVLFVVRIARQANMLTLLGNIYVPIVLVEHIKVIMVKQNVIVVLLDILIL